MSRSSDSKSSFPFPSSSSPAAAASSSNNNNNNNNNNNASKSGVKRNKTSEASKKKGIRRLFSSRKKKADDVIAVPQQENTPKSLEPSSDFVKGMIIHNLDEKIKAEEERRAIIFSQTVSTWQPPESWAVDDENNNRLSRKSTIKNVDRMSTISRDQSCDTEEFKDDEQLLSLIKSLIPEGKTFLLRIYKSSKTPGDFITVKVSLDTTAQEIVKQLCEAFLIPESSRVRLYLVENVCDTALESDEKPLLIALKQTKLIGYESWSDIIANLEVDMSFAFFFMIRESSFSHYDIVTLESRIRNGESDVVSLEGANLNLLPTELFKRAECIKYLDLSRNIMVPYPTDFYQNCLRLQTLHLRENGLDEIPQAIAYITTLETLDLSQNGLTNTSLKPLLTLKNIKSLNLRCNSLTAIPDELSHLENLRTVDLSNNMIKSIGSEIGSMRNIAKLNLSYNCITSISVELGKLVNLQSLNLSNNELSVLPTSMKYLTELEFLDIQANYITDLSSLGNLKLLQTLIADHNRISEVPSHLSLGSLMSCSLLHNPLNRICDHLNFTNLTNLDLTKCNIEVIPISMINAMQSIQRLILDRNNLSSLPDAICNLSELRELSVRHNQLTSLPSGIHNLRSLQILNALCNDIKNIPKSIWRCRLKYLNLSTNSLTRFPDPPTSRFRHTINGDISDSSNSNPSSSVVNSRKTSLVSSNSSGTALKQKNRVGLSKRDLRGPRKNSTSVIRFEKTGKPSEENEANGSSATGSEEIMPLRWSLVTLNLADNRIGSKDEEAESLRAIASLETLRVLNLSFCDIHELGPMFLSDLRGLEELCLSGNQISTLPDNISELNKLKYLYLDGNRFSALPAELEKLQRLQVLDVSKNNLRYNIHNYPYDWNWGLNPNLTHLNLAGNHKLEVRLASQSQLNDVNKISLDFGKLEKLRVLDLSDVKIDPAFVPMESDKIRIRSDAHSTNAFVHGISDAIINDSLLTWDMAVSNFRGFTDEHLWGLFVDNFGNSVSRNNLLNESTLQTFQENNHHSMSRFICDNFAEFFMNELKVNRSSSNVQSCLTRTFLALQREYAVRFKIPAWQSVSAVGTVVYRAQDKIYFASVGDTMSVISRNGQAVTISKKNCVRKKEEIRAIRELGGFFDENGLVMAESEATNCFGNYHLFPFTTAKPSLTVEDIDSDKDEFIIMGSPYFWKVMTEQDAVDVARSSSNHNSAAQKLRDIALSYGAKESFCVMVVPIEKKWYIEAETRKLESAYRKADDIPNPSEDIAMVFADIKQYTYLWERYGEDSLVPALRKFYAIVEKSCKKSKGCIFKFSGDGVMVTFKQASQAIQFCLDVQRELLKAEWPRLLLRNECQERYHLESNHLIFKGLWVRMGIHFGRAGNLEMWEVYHDFIGRTPTLTSRICDAAEGGQIFVSVEALEQGRKESASNVSVVVSGPSTTGDSYLDWENNVQIFDAGIYELKGIQEPVNLFAIYPAELAGRHDYFHGKYSNELRKMWRTGRRRLGSPKAVSVSASASTTNALVSAPISLDTLSVGTPTSTPFLDTPVNAAVDTAQAIQVTVHSPGTCSDTTATTQQLVTPVNRPFLAVASATQQLNNRISIQTTNGSLTPMLSPWPESTVSTSSEEVGFRRNSNVPSISANNTGNSNISTGNIALDDGGYSNTTVTTPHLLNTDIEAHLYDPNCPTPLTAPAVTFAHNWFNSMSMSSSGSGTIGVEPINVVVNSSMSLQSVIPESVLNCGTRISSGAPSPVEKYRSLKIVADRLLESTRIAVGDCAFLQRWLVHDPFSFHHSDSTKLLSDLTHLIETCIAVLEISHLDSNNGDRNHGSKLSLLLTNLDDAFRNGDPGLVLDLIKRISKDYFNAKTATQQISSPTTFTMQVRPNSINPQ